MKFIRIYVWLLAVVLLAGCSKDKTKGPEEKPEEEQLDPGNFVSATAQGNYTVAQMKTIARLAGYDAAGAVLDYDVNFVKVVYKTTYKGRSIEASGLLAIPKNNLAVFSVISAQHGTAFLTAAAPSDFPSASAFTGFELLASAGFITAIPDYIGYGASKSVQHPYYDKKYAAAAVTGMLKASAYYLKKQKISFSERLFLLGYSEGGYVSLAAQQAIENNPIAGFSLKGVAAGAGGYSVGATMNLIINSTTYKDPAYLALILHAYNVTYDWKRPLTDFFRQPYAGRLGALLDGTSDGSEINAQLNTDLTNLFNPGFISALFDPQGELLFKQAGADNDLTDWKPKTPLRLYHGTADETVPYQTSEGAFNSFKAAGATQVSLVPVPGGTHQTAVLPMMLDVLPWFRSLDK